MADINALIAAVQSRLELKDPATETDITLKVDPTFIQSVIEKAALLHNPTYTDVALVPPAEEIFVLWLSMIDILYAAASGNARYFKIQAQGAELNKQQRVAFFLEIAEGLQKRYDSMWARYLQVGPSIVEITDTWTRSPGQLGRAFRLSDSPSSTLQAVTITSTTVDLTWSGYPKRRCQYTLYQAQALIVDEFEVPSWASDIVYVPILDTAEQLFTTDVPFQNKFRVKNLLPNTEYHFCIVLVDSLGKWGYNEIVVTTLAA